MTHTTLIFPPASRASLKIALLYTLSAGLWIVLSDRLLNLIPRDPQTATLLQTPKGWFFTQPSFI